MLIGASVLVLRAGEAPKPLWPGSRYTAQDRDRAVERGLQFIYKVASDPKAFAVWGHDLIECFYNISVTSRNPKLRELAVSMGHELALEWRREHPEPPQTDPVDLSNFVEGSMAATGLGAADVRDDATREQVRRIAARYSAADFLKFDPAREPASSLQFKDKYEIWLDALIATYRGDVYGVRFGASYDDVLRRIRVMRPYPSPKKLGLDETFYATYAITHVIYTLNDYGKYRLSRSWLPQEYKYLRQNLSEAIEEEDPEMLGEFMDTLRAFGMSEKDAPIRAAVAFELSHQNADGSWGDLKSESLYDRYHSTWTAVDGLREYLFLDEQLRRPELMPIIGR